METDYTLDEIIKKYNIILDDNDDKDLFVSIMNGKFNKDANADYEDPLILTYIGAYYQFVKQQNGYDYKSMEKYYLKVLDTKNNYNLHDNSRYYIIYSLGRYYQIIKQYDSMKKYYHMVIGNTNQSDTHYTSQYAMLALGNYYRSIKEPTSYELMKKYYLMTIYYNNNNSNHISNNKYSINAMIWLANYYLHVERKYDLMRKYLEMAIDNTNHYHNDSNNDSNNDIDNIIKERVHAMKALGYYYKNIEKNMILMEKYLLLAIETATSRPINNKTTEECLSNLPLSTHSL
jgi:hypothetical protein